MKRFPDGNGNFPLEEKSASGAGSPPTADNLNGETIELVNPVLEVGFPLDPMSGAATGSDSKPMIQSESNKQVLRAIQHLDQDTYLKSAADNNRLINNLIGRGIVQGLVATKTDLLVLTIADGFGYDGLGQQIIVTAPMIVDINSEASATEKTIPLALRYTIVPADYKVGDTAPNYKDTISITAVHGADVLGDDLMIADITIDSTGITTITPTSDIFTKTLAENTEDIKNIPPNNGLIGYREITIAGAGTYTPSANVTGIKVSCIGGGGGGGGATNGGAGGTGNNTFFDTAKLLGDTLTSYGGGGGAGSTGAAGAAGGGGAGGSYASGTGGTGGSYGGSGNNGSIGAAATGSGGKGGVGGNIRQPSNIKYTGFRSLLGKTNLTIDYTVGAGGVGVGGGGKGGDGIITIEEYGYIQGWKVVPTPTENTKITVNEFTDIDTLQIEGADVTNEEEGVAEIDITGSSYTLPHATDTKLGGVKTGTHTSTDEDGALEVLTGGGKEQIPTNFHVAENHYTKEESEVGSDTKPGEMDIRSTGIEFYGEKTKYNYYNVDNGESLTDITTTKVSKKQIMFLSASKRDSASVVFFHEDYLKDRPQVTIIETLQEFYLDLNGMRFNTSRYNVPVDAGFNITYNGKVTRDGNPINTNENNFVDNSKNGTYDTKSFDNSNTDHTFIRARIEIVSTTTGEMNIIADPTSKLFALKMTSSHLLTNMKMQQLFFQDVKASVVPGQLTRYELEAKEILDYLNIKTMIAKYAVTKKITIAPNDVYNLIDDINEAIVTFANEQNNALVHSWFDTTLPGILKLPKVVDGVGYIFSVRLQGTLSGASAEDTAIDINIINHKTGQIVEGGQVLKVASPTLDKKAVHITTFTNGLAAELSVDGLKLKVFNNVANSVTINLTGFELVIMGS